MLLASCLTSQKCKQLLLFAALFSVSLSDNVQQISFNLQRDCRFWCWTLIGQFPGYFFSYWPITGGHCVALIHSTVTDFASRWRWYFCIWKEISKFTPDDFYFLFSDLLIICKLVTDRVINRYSLLSEVIRYSFWCRVVFDISWKYRWN